MIGQAVLSIQRQTVGTELVSNLGICCASYIWLSRGGRWGAV
jgi:hypothetical protein